MLLNHSSGLENHAWFPIVVEAVGSTEKQFAVSACIAGAEVEFLTLQALALVKVSYLAGFGVVTCQAVVSAEPEIACGIRLDAVYGIICEAVAC